MQPNNPFTPTTTLPTEKMDPADRATGPDTSAGNAALYPPAPSRPASRRDALITAQTLAGRKILVTDAGRGSALAIIRSLGRQGCLVIAADEQADSLGFRSRYTHTSVVYPSPTQDAPAFVETLRCVAHQMQVDLIIPVTDEVILPLAAARDAFESPCQLALPEPAALETVTNKQKTFQLAQRLGVPIPATHLVHSVEEAAAIAPALGWPIVLKPMRSRIYDPTASTKAYAVRYASDIATLLEEMRHFEGHCPVLLQTYVAGTGYGVEVLMAEGRLLAAFQHKRLREYPVTGGVSTFRESVPLHPALVDYATRLLAALRWTGLAMVEFKVGPAGPHLMEINGRVWGSLPLAVHSGMDFPRLLAELYLHGPSPASALPQIDYRVGIRSRNLELELKWMVSVLLGRQPYPFLPRPGRRAVWPALLDLLHPRHRDDILSWADPGPGWALLPALVRKYLNPRRRGEKAP